jgi:hypothetical protein
MLRLFLLMSVALAGLLRFLRLHLMAANDKGSPDPAAPFPVDEPYFAQAIYGRVGPDKETDHYTFQAEGGLPVSIFLLIPTASYSKGLRAKVTLSGPGLPSEGITPELGEKPLSIAGMDYVQAQIYPAPLPETGQYQVAVQRQDGAGAYCFCIGNKGEGKVADPSVYARVAAIMAYDK